MTRRTYPTPVDELPFIDSLTEVGMGDRKRLGLYLPSGHRNDYRIEKMLGRGASRKDPEWDREKKILTCCGSKSYWRHKVACPKLKFEDEL